MIWRTFSDGRSRLLFHQFRNSRCPSNTLATDLTLEYFFSTRSFPRNDSAIGLIALGSETKTKNATVKMINIPIL